MRCIYYVPINSGITSTFCIIYPQISNQRWQTPSLLTISNTYLCISLIKHVYYFPMSNISSSEEIFVQILTLKHRFSAPDRCCVPEINFWLQKEPQKCKYLCVCPSLQNVQERSMYQGFSLRELQRADKSLRELTRACESL